MKRIESHPRIRRSPGSSLLALGLVLLCGLVIPTPSGAQLTYDSGSSGVHGSFPPNQASGTRYILLNMTTGLVTYCSSYGLDYGETCSNTPLGTEQLPGSFPLTTGIFEFTNVDIQRVGISSGFLYFIPVGNAYNQPLTILSQDDILLPNVFKLFAEGLNGVPPSPVQLARSAGTSGPGGFDGGTGSNGSGALPPPFGGNPGGGPSGGAGGTYSADTPGLLVGQSAGASPATVSLKPPLGGSGGGGSTGIQSDHPLGCIVNGTGVGGSSGGGGGGALILAASDVLHLGPDTNTSVDVSGGAGTDSNAGSACNDLGSGGGAGGSIRLVAREISGGGRLVLGGGNHGSGGTGASGGTYRVEAWANGWSTSITGAAGGTFLAFPSTAVPSTLPSLQIATIDGVAVVNPQGDLGSPDVTLPAAPTNPVTVTLAASGIPLGTVVDLRLAGTVGDLATATSTGLAGTQASSTASASLDIPPGPSLITAVASFMIASPLVGALTELADFGDELPDRIEVVAAFDGPTQVYAVTLSGTRKELEIGLPWQQWVAN